MLVWNKTLTWPAVLGLLGAAALVCSATAAAQETERWISPSGAFSVNFAAQGWSDQTPEQNQPTNSGLQRYFAPEAHGEEIVCAVGESLLQDLTYASQEEINQYIAGPFAKAMADSGENLPGYFTGRTIEFSDEIVGLRVSTEVDLVGRRFSGQMLYLFDLDNQVVRYVALICSAPTDRQEMQAAITAIIDSFAYHPSDIPNAQESHDWEDESGVVRLSFESQGWAVVPYAADPDRVYPPAPLLTVAPGGIYDPASLQLRPHCQLTAPWLSFWESEAAASPSQMAANQYFQELTQSTPLPREGRRYIDRDGVAVQALDFKEGQAQMVIYSFMLATEHGPLMYVLHCTTPVSDTAALAQARAIVETLRFAPQEPVGQ